MKILHIFNNPDNQFCVNFITALRESDLFNNDEHYFLIRFDYVYNVISDKNHIILDLNTGSLVKKYSTKFDFFILHSFCIEKEPVLIPKKIRKKVLWRTWGDDYWVSPKTKNIVKKCKNLIISFRTRRAIRGLYGVGLGNYIDEVDIKKRFGKNIKTYIFPYSLKNREMPKIINNKLENRVNIMIGHSGHNNDKHLRIIKLFKNVSSKFYFYIPFAYGKKKYMELVESRIPENWNGRCNLIKKRSSYQEYCDLISKMSFMILPYDRSYALGNLMIALNYGVNIIASKYGPIYKVLIQENIPVIPFEDLTPYNLDEMLVYKPYQLHYKKLKIYAVEEKLNFLVSIFNDISESLYEANKKN